jgi:hypothetical protein
MEEDIGKTLNVIDIMMNQRQGSASNIHSEFEKFKYERKFKKKFIGYLIEHVIKQTDLLSKKMIEEKSKKLYQ